MKTDVKRNYVKGDYVKSIFYCIINYKKIYFVNINGNELKKK